MRTLRAAALATGVAALCPALAQGGGGRLEINQACATRPTGCFAGDAANFPVQISQAGSYVLTSELVVPAGVGGIVVQADGVSLDLNGFRVKGPLVCTGQGTALDCGATAPGGVGIDATATLGSVIENGQVSGFENGIFSEGGVVRGIVARWNFSDGLSVRGAAITGCVATENGRRGIHGSLSSLVGNVALYNRESGIEADGGSVVSQNSANFNGFSGIGGSRSQITENAAQQNAADGIDAGIGSLVADNVVHDNVGDGIQASEGSSVQRNASYANQGYGLNLSSGGTLAGYRGNLITANVTGTVSGGSDLGDNLCNGSKTCP